MPTAESPDENVETEPVDVAPEPQVEIQQETPVSEAVSPWDAVKQLPAFAGKPDEEITAGVQRAIEREHALAHQLQQYQSILPVASEYLSNRELYERWKAGQIAPQQAAPQPAAEEHGWWNPPKIRDAYRQYLVKDEHGREVIAAEAPLDARHALAEYQAYRAEFAKKFLENPEETLAPMVAKVAEQRAQELIQQQWARRDEEQFVSQVEHENVRGQRPTSPAQGPEGEVGRRERSSEKTGALQDLSFNSISSAGPNAAINHYRPDTNTNRKLELGSLFLLDSGGQYLDGTTDVTRTMAIGEASNEMKDRNTRVLKGHIALSRVRFPKGTSGSALDVLARMALWEAGLDYDHGTGHGVGSYLGVHEGPHRVAKAPNAVPLEPGMILSNEPGYYKANAWGIRIENLLVVTPASAIPGGDREMLGFETLTLAPLDRRLIVTSLLSEAERAWVDGYHARVLDEVGPLLSGDDHAWLAEACRPL